MEIARLFIGFLAQWGKAVLREGAEARGIGVLVGQYVGVVRVFLSVRFFRVEDFVSAWVVDLFLGRFYRPFLLRLGKGVVEIVCVEAIVVECVVLANGVVVSFC